LLTRHHNLTTATNAGPQAECFLLDILLLPVLLLLPISLLLLLPQL
jgi:hypothetical protein